MFSASDAYGKSFEKSGWEPYGMNDAVRADEGFTSMAKDPLEAHGMEMRMAGDGLANYVSTLNAKEQSESAVNMANELKSKQDEANSPGFGSIAKTGLGILGSVVGGPAGGAAGGLLGGLFG
jgi:hypothetical protein